MPEQTANTASRRIAVIIDNLEMGGAQNLLETQVGQMSLSHSFLVVNFGDETPLAVRLAALGADVRSNRLGKLTDLAGQMRLRREIAQWKPDLIHTHLLYATLVGSFLARWQKVPHVTTLHNEKPESEAILDRIKSRLERHVLSHRTTSVIACGKRIEVAHRSRVGETPLVTVMNRVRPLNFLGEEERKARRDEMGFAPEEIVFLAAGRLVAQKGFDILIAAFERATYQKSGVSLMIAGEGKDRAALELQAADLHLSDRLKFLGPVADLGQVLQLADVFILSSRHEGLPLVLVEALAAARPVISTRVGDVDSVLDDQCGLLVEPEQVEPLADAIMRMLNDEALMRRMGEAAFAASKKFTDVSSFAAELEAVYVEARQRHERRT